MLSETEPGPESTGSFSGFSSGKADGKWDKQVRKTEQKAEVKIKFPPLSLCSDRPCPKVSRCNSPRKETHGTKQVQSIEIQTELWDLVPGDSNFSSSCRRPWSGLASVVAEHNGSPPTSSVVCLAALTLIGGASEWHKCTLDGSPLESKFTESRMNSLGLERLVRCR